MIFTDKLSRLAKKLNRSIDVYHILGKICVYTPLPQSNALNQAFIIITYDALFRVGLQGNRARMLLYALVASRDDICTFFT